MTWSNPPTNFGDEMRRAHADLVQEMSFKVFNGVTLKTPVRTGRARASWNHSEGSPDNTVAPEFGPHIAPQTFGEVSFFGDRSVPDYPTFYVTNNLPYIMKLEMGSSKQAPGGMVGLTLGELTGGFFR